MGFTCSGFKLQQTELRRAIIRRSFRMADDRQIQDLNLPELFDDVYKKYRQLEETNDPTNTESVQSLVKDGQVKCEMAVFMVNKLQLFSDNEDIEEVATNEMKYMLLSAYLGYFTLKNTKEDRMVLLEKAEQNFKDFLRLCKSYSVCDRLIPNMEEATEPDKGDNSVKQSGPPDLNAMKREREEKIRRFKEKKETDKRLTDLSEAVKKSQVDEEVKREYYLTLLKHWMFTSLEELSAIKDEIPIIEHMKKLKIGGATNQVNPQPKKPFRPFILTKSDLQKQVFGLGYPGIPTMTLEEFYEKKVADGTFQLHGESLQDWARNPDQTASIIEQEDVEKEENIDKDDPVTLIRERNWDNWKDDHRRGWGNRQNMG